MQSPPPPTSSVGQQHFQTSHPPAMGQTQMSPGPQSPHMSPQMSPLQSPTTSMPMAGPPMAGQPMTGPPMTGPPMAGQSMAGPPMAGQTMAGPPMAGMGIPFPGQHPPGTGGFQQPGQGAAGPPGYPQQAGNCDTVNKKSWAVNRSNLKGILQPFWHKIVLFTYW